MKIAGSKARSEVGSGSEYSYVSQRYRSADPDPDPVLYQNVADPQHSLKHWLIEKALCSEAMPSRIKSTQA
jgi:hypothetical protein